MRAEFAQAMLALFDTRRDLVFITGDLGYLALEGVAQAYGERFINAGVAEQNAVSLAAGLAREGQLPWVYSAAVFAVLRPYEQIRNDVCLHQLPVKLVGNGGGYAYGIMGATHHALEDVGALRVLPNMRLYLPLVATDVARVVNLMADDPLPNYLRLGHSATLPLDIPAFAPWRKLKPGRSRVVIGMGPVIQNLFALGEPELLEELEIWSVGTFPLEEVPEELAASITQKRRVISIEEHYRAGGLGEALSHLLLTSGLVPESMASLHAAGYPSGRYGSQAYHQAQSGLLGPGLVARLKELVRA
ncbi:MAG: transketolase [Polyangiaceae bacterium]